MSKEYRKEVELKIRTVINLWEEQPLINDDQIEELINLYYELCQLKPKNQVVIAEGEIMDIETTRNTLKFIFKSGSFDYVEFPFGKKVKIILESEEK